MRGVLRGESFMLYFYSILESLIPRPSDHVKSRKYTVTNHNRSTLILLALLVVPLSSAAKDLSDGIIDRVQGTPLTYGADCFQEEALRTTIEMGTYGMIESTSRCFAKRSREVKLERFQSLHRDLIKEGIPHRQITGAYRGSTTDLSFLVIKPGEMDEAVFKKMLFSLGAKYRQQSIIYSASLRPGKKEKRNYLLFTTGEHAGYSRSGIGFIEGNFENYSLILTEEGTEIFIGTYHLENEYRKHTELIE